MTVKYLGFPLDDAMAMALWAANLGGDLLALLLIGDRLLLDLLGVADLLRLSKIFCVNKTNLIFAHILEHYLWNTVLGLDSLVGDAALGSGHSFGHGLDNRAGYSHCWGMMGKAGTVAKAAASAVAEASSVPGLSLSNWRGSGISHGSCGHARISNKLKCKRGERM